MRNTVDTAVTQRDIQEDKVHSWVNDEARGLLSTMRQVLNDEYLVTVQATTAATGVATTIWTSDRPQLNAVWMVEARVVGWGTTGLLAAYVLRASFLSVAGAVSQVGPTVTLYSQESAAACDADLTLSGTSIVLQVTDDGAQTYNWLASVQVTRTR